MTDFTKISDETLLSRSAAGDEAAFVALYRRRQPVIYRFALHMSGSTAIAEEVTQDVFLAIIREATKFDESRGSALGYLFAIGRNLVLKALQRNRAYVGLEDEDIETTAASDNVLSDLSRAQTIEGVRQAVLQLPAAYREAVVLCDLQELTYADAAEAMQVPIGTVRSRIARGRAILAQRLSGQDAKGSNSLRCSV